MSTLGVNNIVPALKHNNYVYKIKLYSVGCWLQLQSLVTQMQNYFQNCQ